MMHLYPHKFSIVWQRISAPRASQMHFIFLCQVLPQGKLLLGYRSWVSNKLKLTLQLHLYRICWMHLVENCEFLISHC